jgi:predicted nucleic-acid-binding Zn-ribbon protein
MKLSPRDLDKAVGNALRFFDRQKIDSLDGLLIRGNRDFLLDIATQEYIRIQTKRCSYGKMACTLRYTVPERGNVLDLLLDEATNSSQIVVRGAFQLPRYETSGRDPYGHIINYKEIPTTDLGRIRCELEALRLS